jgi:hypothetical protein
MKINKHLNCLTKVIFSPLRLIFWGLKLLLLFLLREEIRHEKNKYETLLKKNGEINIKLSKTEGLNKLLNDKTDRLKTLIHHYHNDEVEFDKTEKDENVFIFSPKHMEFYGLEFYSFYLCGMDGEDRIVDCQINLSNYPNAIKIDDIISNTKKRGYAKTLLNYTIRKAQASGIERIYGELSPVDADSFSWLIPFYESLGFTCILSNDKQMGGKLELKLITAEERIWPC